MTTTRINLGLFFVIPILAITFFAGEAAAQNSITGLVFDQDRRPVNNINVELLDSFERLIGTRKTQGSGFFSFQRLNQGVYFLKVRVAGTNFREQRLRVDLGDLNAIGGIDQKQIDIYLEIDPRAQRKTPARTGVIFAQNVPEDARTLLAKAVKQLKKGSDKDAEASFIRALEIFPDYFEALEKIGDLYLRTKKFKAAELVFLRAVKVNPRCFGCFFNLAIAQSNLRKLERSVESLGKANALDSGSINVHLLMGIVLRDLERYEQAEENLLTARRLGDNKHADVNWELAELYYFKLKKPAQAADELERYLKNLSRREKKENARKVESVKKLIRKIRSEASKRS